MEEHWDNLIILDACRYDYFSRVCHEYFSGELRRVKSLGSHTLEWCLKSFPDRYEDVVYVSGSLFINSGVGFSSFTARDHFHKIIDACTWGWDEKLGTVHPRQVNRAVRISKERFPDKRFIIHYVQPHAPYIGGELRGPGYHRDSNDDRTNVAGVQSSNFLQKRLISLFKLLGKGFRSVERKGIHIGSLDYRLHEVFGLPPVSPMDAMRRIVGVDGLRKAYLENLRFVLMYAKDLIQDLSGTCVITADHGERLGERGDYDHPLGFSDPLLREIPWFKVESSAIGKASPIALEKRRVRGKIEQLKASGTL